MYTAPIRLKTALRLALMAISVSCADFPIVETTSGTIRGSYTQPGLRTFLGIPYAHPPVGSLRFKAPQPIQQKAREVIDATAFGLSCYQHRAAVPGAPALTPTTGESEDCLTLNVWASENHSKRPKPVFIWMHGGGFTEGSSSVPMYDGHYFAAAHPDVVIVTINFRINFFGYANSPAVPEKNVGFRDQRLAIEWIRDNIAAFGGDPNRMVLGGQSAGAMSASIYAYAYPTDPIVRGLIMESGEATVTRPEDGTQWARMVEALGCRSSNSTEELGCMQNIDGYKLKRALSPEDLIPLTSAPVARPAVDNITYFEPAEYVARGTTGHFAKIPALRGLTNNEGNGLSPFTPAGIVNQTYADFLTSAFFNCPAAGEASTWVAHKIPSWRYRYFGEFPSLAVYDWMKSYHGAEIPLLLGTMENVQLRHPQAYEFAAQKYLQNAIVAFIKDPDRGLKDFGWPLYNPNTTSLVALFKNNSSNAMFVDPAPYDTICRQL